MKAEDEMQKSIDNSDIGKFVKWLTDSRYKIVPESREENHVMLNYRDDQNQYVLERYITKLAKDEA